MIIALGAFLGMGSSLPPEATQAVLVESETMHPGEICP